MGSAIKEFYVHLYARNYNRAGINRLREGRMEPYNYQKKIADINSRIPIAKDNKKLEENLQRLMGKGNPEDSEKTVREIQNAIEKILNDSSKNAIDKINWSKLNITREQFLKEKGIIDSKIKVANTKNYVYLKTIMARVRAIESLQKNITSALKKNKLQSLINQIYREISVILNAAEGINIDIKELQTLDINAMQKFNPRIRWNKKSINLVQMINEVLKLYAITPLVAVQKGELLEYAVSGAWLLAQVEAGVHIDDMIEAILSQITGRQTSHIKVDFTKLGVTDDITFQDVKLEGYRVDEYTKVAWAVLPSQEKVDVQIDLLDGTQAISAKNINLTLGYDISLVSGSPLSYLIQDEDKNFKGHYLNLVASHADTISIQQNNALAHRAMKYVILFKALTGATYGRQNIVDTFVLNDNSTGEIRIYSIEELLRRASSNLDLYAKVNINGKKGTPLEQLVIDNTRQKTWQDRLLHYARNIHKQKVYAALSNTLFSSGLS